MRPTRTVAFLVGVALALSALPIAAEQAMAQVFTEPAKPKPAPKPKPKPKPKAESPRKGDTVRKPPKRAKPIPSAPNGPAERYDDAVTYCAARGSVNRPDIGYTGPDAPDWMRTGVARSLDITHMPDLSAASLQWRCRNARVMACWPAQKGDCERHDVKAAPPEAVKQYCKSRSDGPVPILITGASPAQWSCAKGKPIMGSFDLQLVDSAGFMSSQWHDVTAFAPQSASGAVSGAYIGQWGLVANDGGAFASDYVIGFTFTGGAVGSIVGKADYFKESKGAAGAYVCSMDLILAGVEGYAMVLHPVAPARKIKGCPKDNGFVIDYRRGKIWTDWVKDFAKKKPKRSPLGWGQRQ